MATSVVLTCLFALQQLQVGPAPARVGDEVVVRASRASIEEVPVNTLDRDEDDDDAAGVRVPAPQLLVRLAIDGGPAREVGRTDEFGDLRVVLTDQGAHAFEATIDGVRCLAAIPVGPEGNRLLLGLATVPLGLVLLWLQVRGMRRWRRRELGVSS